MQTFTQLYKELAEKIAESVQEVQWIDLWNSQVYHLEQEHPFPTPAVFLAFRSNGMTDLGTKTQNVNAQIDVFLFYETFLDTYRGAYNQADALKFLEIMDKLKALLHGSSGENYSNMRQVAFSPVDTGGAGNLWSTTYNAVLIDYAAQKKYEEDGFDDVNVQPFDPQI